MNSENKTVILHKLKGTDSLIDEPLTVKSISITNGNRIDIAYTNSYNHLGKISAVKRTSEIFEGCENEDLRDTVQLKCLKEGESKFRISGTYKYFDEPKNRTNQGEFTFEGVSQE